MVHARTPAVGRGRGDTAESREGAGGQGRGGSAACLDLAGVRERATGSMGVGALVVGEDAGGGGGAPPEWGSRTQRWGSPPPLFREAAMAARRGRQGHEHGREDKAMD